MRYATVDTKKAVAAGIAALGRVKSPDGKRMIVSERDVLYSERLSGYLTVEERIAALGGRLVSDTDIKLNISKNIWI